MASELDSIHAGSQTNLRLDGNRLTGIFTEEDVKHTRVKQPRHPSNPSMAACPSPSKQSSTDLRYLTNGLISLVEEIASIPTDYSYGDFIEAICRITKEEFQSDIRVNYLAPNQVRHVGAFMNDKSNLDKLRKGVLIQRDSNLYIPISTSTYTNLGLLCLGNVSEDFLNQSEYDKMSIGSCLSKQCGQTLSLVLQRDKLMQEAHYDGLTGLLRREKFIADLEKSFTSHKDAGKPLTLVMGDLDLFGGLNDQYGHDHGDKALRVLGKVLVNTIRAGDIGGQGRRHLDREIRQQGGYIDDHIRSRPSDEDEAREKPEAGRFGGEETMVFLPYTSLDGGLNAAERLRTAVQDSDIGDANRLKSPGHKKYHLDANKMEMSVGIACSNQQGINSVEDLLKAVDVALYKAKENGRNQTVVYFHGMAA